MRIPNCSSHYFCVTVLVVKEVVHLPICNELAAYQSRYHSSEDVFHRGKSEHWHLSHYHSSLTLWYPPQLSTKICMKPQAKVYPYIQIAPGSSTLLWFHTQLGILSPLTEQPVQRLQRVQKPSQNKDLHHKFHLTFHFFSTVFHIKAIKKLHKIRILLSVFSANINEYLENYFSQSLKWEQDFFCFNSIPCIHISYYYYFCIFNRHVMSVYRNVHPKDPRGTHQQWQDALVLLPSHLLEHFRKKSTEGFEQRLFSPS